MYASNKILLKFKKKTKRFYENSIQNSFHFMWPPLWFLCDDSNKLSFWINTQYLLIVFTTSDKKNSRSQKRKKKKGCKHEFHQCCSLYPQNSLVSMLDLMLFWFSLLDLVSKLASPFCRRLLCAAFCCLVSCLRTFWRITSCRTHDNNNRS